jgi:L-alanine-DL-glutamate epimerase-like enolase superfamily enzyme
MVVGAIRRNEAAKAALSTALWDLAGKIVGLPVCVLLGGRLRDEVEGVWHVSGEEVGEVKVEAEEGKELGFRVFKLKVGRTALGVDMARLRALRDVLGEGYVVDVDANEAWSVEDALKFCEVARDFGVRMIEQPVRRDDVVGMRRILSASTNVALDESVLGPGDVAEKILEGLVGGLVVKVMKAGGPGEAFRAAWLASATGWKVHVASMPGEGVVGAAAAMHVVAALSGASWGGGIALDPRDAATAGLEFRNGMFRVPRDPGLGIDVEVEGLAE